MSPQIDNRRTLVIRQTPEIHRQIKELPQKLNVDFIEETTFQKADGISDGSAESRETGWAEVVVWVVNYFDS